MPYWEYDPEAPLSAALDEGYLCVVTPLGLLRAVLCALLFVWGLLALFRAPIGFLWKPAVAATEWAHVLALLALGLVAWCIASPGPAADLSRLAAGLAALAALLLLSPLIRAIGYQRHVEDRFTTAFGSVSPRALPGAPARPAPLVLGDLLSVSTPTVVPTRHLYRELPGLSLHLDLYRRSDAPGPQPVVIVIHGGSWNSGDSTQLAWLNGYLAARGIAVAAINYRLAPGHVFPAQRDDVLEAVHWIEKNAERLGLDGSRLALLGRSAGGQLSLLGALTAHDPAIRGAIALYAPSDLNWSWDHPTNPLVLDSHKTLREYLGGTPAEAKSQFDAASAIDFIVADSPPVLLIHGTRDELVFAEQSRRFARRLEGAGVRHVLLELPWATHGCDANPAGPGGQVTTWAIERFLAAVFDSSTKR
ncbi:Esterase/lipase [Minicystis rosea]|nr:Esterase/lipase [Minicystis rosea]